MRSSDKATADLGHKLLPRIVQAVVQAVISAKTGLTAHEFSLKVESGQELIDRMGREAAELIGPYVNLIIDHHGDSLDPMLKDYFESVASGQDQIKAISGLLAGGIQSSLSQVISNYGSAVAYRLNEIAPNLVNDPPTLAQLVATGIQSYDNALLNARYQGLQDHSFNDLIELSRSTPDAADLTEMLRRGLINERDLEGWLQRLALPTFFNAKYVALARQVLTVADAALAVTKGLITAAQGEKIAAENGYAPADWTTILGNTGEPPGPEELMEAFRRKFITEAEFETGIRQSRVRDQWIPTLLKLRYSPLNTADAVNAYVEGYITESEVASIADQNGLEPEQYKILTEAAGDPLSYTDMMRLWRYGKATQQEVSDALRQGRLKDSYINFALALKDAPMSVADAIEGAVQGYLTLAQAKAIALMNGLREEDFEPLYLTAGAPLPKEEMLSLLNRGVVSEDQVKAALRQSRLKDSYIDTTLALRVRLPELYEVRALLGNGSLTAAQGLKLLLETGYQKDIAQDIVNGATGANGAATKELTATVYAGLFEEGAITEGEFITGLKDVGYAQHSAELYAREIDLKIVLAARKSAMSHIRSLYLAGKITEGDAKGRLNELDMPADSVDRILHAWDTEHLTDIKLLSAAQVTDAWFMKIFNPDNEAENTKAALDYLIRLGYDGRDATRLLEIKNKGPLTNAKPNSKGSTTSPAGATSESAGTKRPSTSGSGSGI